MYTVTLEFAPGQITRKKFHNLEEAKKFYDSVFYMYQSADLVDENNNLIYLWNRP